MNASKRGLSQYLRLEGKVPGVTAFLPRGFGRKNSPEEIKLTTYEVLEAVKEILPEGAKNFAPFPAAEP